MWACSRYWTLPIEEPLFYRRSRDYVDEFRELVDTAVADRLRTGRVSVFMSGGLDSPGLAATAARLLRHGPAAHPVKAFTSIYTRLMPDTEGHYAGMVARHLGIPIRSWVADDAPSAHAEAQAPTPEPLESAVHAGAAKPFYADVAAQGRVVFYGEGPDNALLYEWQPYVRHLVAGKRWGRLAADGARHLRAHRRLPLAGMVPRLFGNGGGAAGGDGTRFPDWLRPELVSRLELERRWSDWCRDTVSAHPVRPRGYASMLTPLWQSLFESLEPAYTGAPIEVRHPYLDIRLLRFMLRVPALPWCRRKHLLREALRGALPEAVRTRRKTPLGRDPVLAQPGRQGAALRPVARLAEYGDVKKMTEESALNPSDAGARFRFGVLGRWLSQLESAGGNQEEADTHERRGIA